MGGVYWGNRGFSRRLAILLAVWSLAQLSLASTACADEVRYFQKDGITYQETRRVVQRPIVETKYEQREQIFYREQYKTDFQQTTQTVQVPVTEYRTMACLQNRWNPFAQPYYTYRTVPMQRMEYRQQVVQMPVTRRELVPEKRIVQVPVTSQRIAEEEQITRVAVSNVPLGTTVYSDAMAAGPIGGVARLDGGSPTAARPNGASLNSTFTPYNSQLATQPGLSPTPSSSVATRPPSATLAPSSSVAPSTANRSTTTLGNSGTVGNSGPVGSAPATLSPAPAARPANTPNSTVPGGRY